MTPFPGLSILANKIKIKFLNIVMDSAFMPLVFIENVKEYIQCLERLLR